MTEQTIIRKIRDRDPSGLEALMERYIPYVSAVSWNILRFSMSAEDVEEVVSDVFLAAWNHFDDLRTGQIKPWLGTVARNKARNKLRELGRDLPLEENILGLPGLESPECQMTRSEEVLLIRRAVNEMPSEDREIFLRHYYYAQTVREIAAKMNVNESTVKTRLRRGRIKLKEILTRWGAL